MKNINQGHAVKEVKGEEAPLLKAVLGGGQQMQSKAKGRLETT
jgi:hypothetical protein